MFVKAQVSSKTCCREMQVEFSYSFLIFVQPVFLVLTPRLKNNEAKESLVFLSLFKTHAQATPDSIGSKGAKALTNYCQNIKTALRSVVEEKEIYHDLKKFWPSSI